jgi:hypothetical protein
MNDYDRSNLNFILNLSDKQIPIWFATISEDDKNYAFELLREYRSELVIRALELEDTNGETDIAKDYLKKFTLKGKV